MDFYRVIASAMLALTITAGPAAAQHTPSGPAAQQKEQPAPVVGELAAVDDKSKTIVVRTADSEMKFSYSDKTVIVGADKGIEGFAGTGDTIVKVTYEEHGTAKVALRIEVLPRK